ncbi:hypothetical protein PR048_010600 [Dryococelus australis]|uniref:Uncharacterized protein n=1 Tax=Dryococelus australis TaxID=614101 RepID=A0ABQ9I348_9NEOP|nr:hypothetical protein PR048_010600 [Dryococelus australis]
MTSLQNTRGLHTRGWDDNIRPQCLNAWGRLYSITVRMLQVLVKESIIHRLALSPHGGRAEQGSSLLANTAFPFLSCYTAATVAVELTWRGQDCSQYFKPKVFNGKLWRPMRECEGEGKPEIPEKTRRPAASSARFPRARNQGATSPGIEPGSLKWEASSLTATPPRPPCNGIVFNDVHHTQQKTTSTKGGTGDPRENPLTSAIVRHDSHLRKSGRDPAGDRTRFALVGGEQSNRSATEAPRPEGVLEESSLLSLYTSIPSVRLLASHQGEAGSIPGRVTPEFSLKGTVTDYAAGRRYFLGDLPFSPPLHSGAAPFSPHFTLIGSQDVVVKSHPNLTTLKGLSTHNTFRGTELEVRKGVYKLRAICISELHLASLRRRLYPYPVRLEDHLPWSDFISRRAPPWREFLRDVDVQRYSVVRSDGGTAVITTVGSCAYVQDQKPALEIREKTSCEDDDVVVLLLLAMKEGSDCKTRGVGKKKGEGEMGGNRRG